METSWKTPEPVGSGDKVARTVAVPVHINAVLFKSHVVSWSREGSDDSVAESSVSSADQRHHKTSLLPRLPPRIITFTARGTGKTWRHLLHRNVISDSCWDLSPGGWCWCNRLTGMVPHGFGQWHMAPAGSPSLSSLHSSLQWHLKF